jgi:hypothetical protein
LTLFELNRVGRIDVDLGFAAGSIKLSLFDAIGEVKSSGCFRAVVEIFKSGDDFFYAVADVFLVALKEMPWCD